MVPFIGKHIGLYHLEVKSTGVASFIIPNPFVLHKDETELCTDMYTRTTYTLELARTLAAAQ